MTHQRGAGLNADRLPAFSLAHESFPEREGRLKFDSRSEAACAFFLEMYGQGWRAVEGLTLHVRAGPKVIDFYLPEQKTFVEYHPISRWDWKSSEASRAYGEHFRRLSINEKRESWRIEKLEFARRYYDMRRLVLDLTGHKDANLIHAQDGRDFYRQVLRGIFRAPTAENDFLREWSAFLNSH